MSDFTYYLLSRLLIVFGVSLLLAFVIVYFTVGTADTCAEQSGFANECASGGSFALLWTIATAFYGTYGGVIYVYGSLMKSSFQRRLGWVLIFSTGVSAVLLSRL